MPPGACSARLKRNRGSASLARAKPTTARCISLGESIANNRLVAAVAEKLGGTAAPQQEKRTYLPQRRLWQATAALLLIVAAAGIALDVLRSGGAEAGPASLAVLPFKNMSAGEPY